jgi:hypothetical protein
MPNISIFHITEKKIFWILACLLLLVAALYVYFLNQTINGIMTREVIYEENMRLASRLSELEADYIALSNAVSLKHAYSMGFIEAPKTVFISRRSVERNLSFKPERYE